nr:class I poly(R)-hydroxyalkanoic acid synthase [uncultured Cohaesibacter sp.]
MVKEDDKKGGEEHDNSNKEEAQSSRDHRHSFFDFDINDPDKLTENLACFVEEAGKIAANYRQKKAQEKHARSINYANQMHRAFAEISSFWMSDPARSIDAQTRFWEQIGELWASTHRRMQGSDEGELVQTPQDDIRFSDPDWRDYPYFSFLKQLYFVTSQWANEMIDEAESVDDHTRHKARFYLKQLSHALSPSNFIFSNPTLLRETFEHNGENLIRGMEMLAEDMKTGGDFFFRQTATSVFSVGENLAITPGKVVAQNDICQLIQYDAQTKDVIKTPLVIFPSWINKFYILDLDQKKSFIRWCVENGHTVFAVSWVNPDETLRDKDFAAYMFEGIISSIEIVRDITGEERVNAIGYCVGGTLLSAAMAYLAAKNLDWINSATLFASQVDFSEAGDLKVFIDEEQLDELEAIMDRQGYLDGITMANIFNMLRPNDLIWPYFVNNYMRGIEPFPFDFLFWNQDVTRMTKACHSFYLRQCYLENRLAEGRMVIDAVPLDLRSIKTPIYCLALKEDHIAPAQSIFKGSKLFGGPVDFVLGGSGHIAGVVNPPSRVKYQYWRNEDHFESLGCWLDSATATPGSWWPDWHQWILAKGEESVSARNTGSEKFPGLESAPGTFVRKVY